MTTRLVLALIVLAGLVPHLFQSRANAEATLLILPRTLHDNERLYRPGSYTRTAISLSAGQALLGISPHTTTIIAHPSVTSVSVTGNPKITFTRVDGQSNDTIEREDSGSWITDGFTVGHAVWIDGAENEANNIIDGYVSSVTADTLTQIRPELVTEGMVGGTMTGSPSLTFAEQGATGDTITRNSGDWESDGFEPGMEITVTGTASNNITNAYIAEITSPTILTLGPTDLAGETSLTASVVGSCRVRGVPNFIQTANFNTASAVEAGPVSGLTIDGNLLTTGPYGSTAELQEVPVANGVFIDAQHAIISDNRIKGFRGYGAGVQTSNTTGALGMTRIDRNFITLCWSGIRLRHSDMSASLNVVAGCRDYGIHVSGGSFRTTDNHCYGMKYALFLDGASGFNSANDMFADSEYGVYSPGSSNVTSFINTKIYNNFVRGMKFEGTANSVINPQVDVPPSSPLIGSPNPWRDKVGIEFSGHSNTILGGLINLHSTPQEGHGTPTASTALRISGNNCRVDTTIYDQDNLTGSRGLNIPARLTYTFTADAATDTFTSAGHALANNDPVHVSNVGGALPTGLSAATTYYVVGVAANTFQLSATQGGGSINITDAGTGTHTIGTGIRGGEFKYRIYGFEGSGDAALDIDEASLTGVTITIVGNSVRSPGFMDGTDAEDLSQYIDIPAGWGNGTTITLIDEATGQELPLPTGDNPDD